MKSQKLEKLSKKFGIASKMSDELNDLVEEMSEELVAPPIATHELILNQNITNEVALIEEIEEPVFSTNQLKADFLMIKQNLNGLVVKGQRILDSAMCLDLADLKASQLDALTNLQNSIANNLKLMISIYREIAEIEKLRIKQTKLEPVNSSVNMGTVINNQILMQGSTNDLLDLINKHTNKD